MEQESGKYYIKPANPESYNYEAYYDDSQAKDDHIYARGDGFEVNKDLREDVKNSLESLYEDIADDKDELITSARYNFKKNNGQPLTMPEIRRLAVDAIEFYSARSNEEDDIIADALSIIYSEEFTTGGATGYSQGDYLDMIYPKRLEKLADWVGHVWLATGTEYMLTTEKHDKIPDFYEVDVYHDFCSDDNWGTNKVKKWAADSIGCKPEEVEVLNESGEIED